MERLEGISKYSSWKKHENNKEQSIIKRQDMAKFTFRALLGSYDVVYLTDVRRTLDGEKESDFFSEFAAALAANDDDLQNSIIDKIL